MSDEQIRLQVPPKLFGIQQLDRADDQAVNSRLLVRRRKMHGWLPGSAAANSRNWQLMISGRSQILATRNFGDWHTVLMCIIVRKDKPTVTNRTSTAAGYRRE